MSRDDFASENASNWAKVRSYLVTNLSRELEADPPPDHLYRSISAQKLDQIYIRSQIQMDDSLRTRLLREVLDEVAGYGPIQPFLDDPDINEIMVNGPKLVFIEKNGELIETNIHFKDNEHVLRIINRMILPLGRRLDRDYPMVDAHLPDGSRVNAIIPPVSSIGPCLTVRKFLRSTMTIEDLIRSGTLTENMAEFLRACIAARLNIIITGPTSSGKTTLLNVLSTFIPEKERIITIEDAIELRLMQRHVIQLETIPPSVDGTGEVTTRDLVRNSLRMRPDRIIVGEVRSAEALDMLQAMNTGHHGSMTTLHANSPRDALSRLETMVMMAELDLPLLAIRRQMSSAIDLVIHQSRLSDGTRKITYITEISGMEGEVITMSDIFKYEQTGIGPNGKVIGRLLPTGIRPMFSPRLEVVGYRLKGEIFGGGSEYL